LRRRARRRGGAAGVALMERAGFVVGQEMTAIGRRGS
jgi:hypothetical protein